MKLPCKVIQDMLPMYYDGVCSQESRELVESHLSECQQCNRIYQDIQYEMHYADLSTEDLKPLKKIANEWKKSKRASLKKGACIALAAVFMLTVALVAVWYFSYAGFYYQMTDKMEPTSNNDQFFTSSDYALEKDGYRYEVWLPILLSDSGFARVMNDDGMVMFLYPGVGGDLEISVVLTHGTNSFIKVWLNPDLTPNYDAHKVPVRTDAEKVLIQNLLVERHNEITAMLEAIYDLWGIQYVH